MASQIKATGCAAVGCLYMVELHLQESQQAAWNYKSSTAQNVLHGVINCLCHSSL